MKEKKQTVDKEPQEPQSKRITIHVERYQNLIAALEDRYKVRRVVISVFCIGSLLFGALTVIMLSLKSFFPYSDISTTAFGTTTITDEQKQVSYFLFNTADLWANSGIYVKKGDVISVHSSGSSNTAIHHIDKSASENKTRERNIGPLGERLGRESKKDRLRRQFRIFPNYPSNALIMQVVDPNVDPKSKPSNPTSLNEQNFYYIGAQRDNIHIVEEGVLHFAVNDIVLDSATIEKMMIANMAVMADIETDSVSAKAWSQKLFNTRIWDKLFPGVDYRKQLIERDLSNKETYGVDRTINMAALEALCSQTNIQTIHDTLAKAIKNTNTCKRYHDLLQDPTSFQFGGYGQMDLDSTSYKTEMDYYLEHHYKQAWYDDNLGSFLILVEKDNRNRLSHGE